MRAFALRAVEAMPLAVFLLYMAIANPRAQVEWRASYYAATALAIVGTLLLDAPWGDPAIAIYLGIALYFVSGTIALLTRVAVAQRRIRPASKARRCSIGCWRSALFFTLFNARGYIGLDADPRTVRVELLVACSGLP